MERPSKLADLKLVSKYYPVAQVTNYSYPQPERLSQHGRRRSRLSDDRSSLGSQESSPGLIDDPTDSEVSVDDDYQYHAHGAELWDTFWLPSPTEKKEEFDLQPVKQAPQPVKQDLQPVKQYPALLPSPQTAKKEDPEVKRSPAWPLPESSQPRSRKPTATYSPFPKPFPLPPRTASLIPSWQCSRPMGHTRRRADSRLSTCVSEPSPRTATFPISPDAYKTNFSLPCTPMESHFTLENQPETIPESRPVSYSENKEFPAPPTRMAPPPPPVPSPTKSLPPALLLKQSMPCLRPMIPEPEPHSVFEDDSDSESESNGRSFFRFHKRGESSDTRRSSKSCDPSTRRKRNRACTAPSSPIKMLPERTSTSEMPVEKSRSSDILNRMLGRRSRRQSDNHH